MSPSGKNLSLVGGAAWAKPKSPNCAATRFACPRWPPALSTRTLTVDGGTGGTFANAPADSTSPGGGPAVGSGQAVTPAAAPVLINTVIHVTAVATANTASTMTKGPRR